MSKWIIAILLLINVFSSYVAYQHRESSKLANDKATELTNKIDYFEQQAIKINQIISENTTVKRTLENESIKQQEQINKELADNNCTNTLVPIRVVDRLHDRANKIRQPTSAGKLNK